MRISIKSSDWTRCQYLREQTVSTSTWIHPNVYHRCHILKTRSQSLSTWYQCNIDRTTKHNSIIFHAETNHKIYFFLPNSSRSIPHWIACSFVNAQKDAFQDVIPGRPWTQQNYLYWRRIANILSDEPIYLGTRLSTLVALMLTKFTPGRLFVIASNAQQDNLI